MQSGVRYTYDALLEQIQHSTSLLSLVIESKWFCILI